MVKQQLIVSIVNLECNIKKNLWLTKILTLLSAKKPQLNRLNKSYKKIIYKIFDFIFQNKKIKIG